MRLPEITHGQEHQGSIQLNPNIPEQVELAKRIEQFFRAAGSAAITPTLRSRALKDYRVDQPSGRATISAAYSDEKDGRYSAEVRASHTPSGIESHYSVYADGNAWHRDDSHSLGLSLIDHDDMVADMLEYSPANSSMARLLDEAPTAKSIMKAIFSDMSPGAHQKSGIDLYRAHLTDIDMQSGYAATRRLELSEARANRKITRRLALSALTNIGEGPVDIDQNLMYEVNYGANGAIVKDAIRLVNKSSDGLSSAALAKLAETSDIVGRSTDLLHSALDELSRHILIPNND